jgi:hypothetical protein
MAIYRHDHAASVATDAALGIGALQNDKRVRGWVTEEKDGEIVVTFIDQAPAALYRIVVSKDGNAGPVTTLDPPVQLTAYEASAAQARAAAAAAGFQPCTQNYNSVVLPAGDSSGKDWVVYWLPAATTMDVVPLGGAYRMNVSDAKVVEQRTFTNSCLAVQVDPKALAFAATHVMDPVPTETHVFWSLWAGKPLYISTPPNVTIWAIEAGKIRLIQRK